MFKIKTKAATTTGSDKGTTGVWSPIKLHKKSSFSRMALHHLQLQEGLLCLPAYLKSMEEIPWTQSYMRSYMRGRSTQQQDQSALQLKKAQEEHCKSPKKWLTIVHVSGQTVRNSMRVAWCPLVGPVLPAKQGGIHERTLEKEDLQGCCSLHRWELSMWQM